MYRAMLSPTSPTVAIRSHGFGLPNRPGVKLRPPPATRCFVDEDLDTRVDGHGVSVYRRLLQTALSSPPSTGNFCASAAVVTLERPKVDISQTTASKTAVRPSLEHAGGADDGGGGGGIVGGGHAGRSGGCGDDDDEYRYDEYPEDGGGGDEDLGLFRRRRLVAELFDRETLAAILSEWMKTMKDLPFGLKEACEMGILSSAELSKFLWFNLQPSVSRLFARLLPQGLLTDFNGKIMADPSLPYKLVFEAVCSVLWSVWLDIHSRKSQRIKEEWHLVLTNAVVNAFCNAFVVWSLAPCNGLINFPKLPSNVNSVFERSQRVWKFGVQRRLLSFFRKATAFFALGFAVKFAAQICLSTEKISLAKIGTMSKCSLAAGLSFGLFSNLRYQLIWGIDRSMDLYFDVPKVSLAFCLALRFLNIGIGTQTLNWVGSENEVNYLDLGHSLLSYVGDGHSCGDNWFVLRNLIANGFILLTLPQRPYQLLRRKGGEEKGEERQR